MAFFCSIPRLLAPVDGDGDPPESYVLSFRFALLILLFSNVARYHATGAKAPTRAAVHKLVRSKQDIGATKNITTMTA